MSAVLETVGLPTREQLRQRVDTLEQLEGVMAAIDDITSAGLAAGERVDVGVSDRSMEKRAIAVAHALPPDVVLAGLQAMQHELVGRLQ